MEDNPPHDLHERLGFKDWQAAQDWLAENPQGRLVRILCPSQVKRCQSPACLAEIQSLEAQVATLNQKLGSSVRANPNKQRQYDTNPVGLTNGPNPLTSSSDSLRLTNEQLKTMCDTLTETLATEREQIEKERKAWLAFKKDYAIIVACKIINEQYKQASTSSQIVPVPTTNKNDSLAKETSTSIPVSQIVNEPTGQEDQKTEGKSVKDPLKTLTKKRRSEPEGNTRSSESPKRVQRAHKLVESPSHRKAHSSKHSPRKDLPSCRVTPRLPEHLKLKRQLTTPQSARSASRPGSTRSALPAPKWIRYSDRKARHKNQVFNDHPDSSSSVLPTMKRDPRPPLKTSVDVFQGSKQPIDPPTKTDNQPTKDKDDSTSAKEKENSWLKNKKENLRPAVIPAGPTADFELSTTEESEGERSVIRTKKVSRIGGEGSTGGLKGNQTTAPASSSSSSMSNISLGSEEFPGQQYMRQVHKKRQNALVSKTDNLRCDQPAPKAEGSIVPPVQNNLLDKFEIDPRNNFGVGHVFNEVARGKEIRKQMHAGDCECCTEYYKQAAKDLNQAGKNGDSAGLVSRHQHEISRHRYFNPPPLTPPGFWQLGFPDTQRVNEINQLAEENKVAKLQNIELQAKKGTGPYKFKDS